jgi:hypothetical protein
VYNQYTKTTRLEVDSVSEEMRRINVTFPVELLEDLYSLAPPRKRNQVIVAATADYVRRLKLLAVLKETAGAWDDESHPELATPQDIDRWLHQLRSNWRREPLRQGESRA